MAKVSPLDLGALNGALVRTVCTFNDDIATRVNAAREMQSPAVESLSGVPQRITYYAMRFILVPNDFALMSDEALGMAIVFARRFAVRIVTEADYTHSLAGGVEIDFSKCGNLYLNMEKLVLKLDYRLDPRFVTPRRSGFVSMSPLPGAPYKGVNVAPIRSITPHAPECTFLPALPCELILMILSLLSITSLCRAAGVCRHVNELVNDRILLWRLCPEKMRSPKMETSALRCAAIDHRLDCDRFCFVCAKYNNYCATSVCPECARAARIPGQQKALNMTVNQFVGAAERNDGTPLTVALAAVVCAPNTTAIERLEILDKKLVYKFKTAIGRRVKARKHRLARNDRLLAAHFDSFVVIAHAWLRGENEFRDDIRDALNDIHYGGVSASDGHYNLAILLLLALCVFVVTARKVAQRRPVVDTWVESIYEAASIIDRLQITPTCVVLARDVRFGTALLQRLDARGARVENYLLVRDADDCRICDKEVAVIVHGNRALSDVSELTKMVERFGGRPAIVLHEHPLVPPPSGQDTVTKRYAWLRASTGKIHSCQKQCKNIAAAAAAAALNGKKRAAFDLGGV